MGTRIGIFGGTFDPIHYGHLLLAEICRESMELDHVRFLIANLSPLKTGNAPAKNKDRTEMVQLAIGGNPKFRVDTRELDRGGISYTIDSVRSIATESPGSELFLLMGADTLADISKWRDPMELFRLVTPIVISRGGVGEPNWDALKPYVDSIRLNEIIKAKVTAPQIEISSYDLRDRVRRGKSIRYQIPPGVEMFIREHQLYCN